MRCKLVRAIVPGGARPPAGQCPSGRLPGTCEHGATSPVSHIREAIAHLHASADALATVFAVDLARVHQARLEALLGAPLPASLVGEGKEGRTMARKG